jgi:hypothetical protein
MQDRLGLSAEGSDWCETSVQLLFGGTAYEDTHRLLCLRQPCEPAVVEKEP